jgi:hypothetical protein
VLIIIIYLWWSNGKVLNSNAGGQSSNPMQNFFIYILTMTSLGAPVRSQAQVSYLFLSSFWDYISSNDFGNIWMNFGNEFWLILCQEYINSKLFAVSTGLWGPSLSSFDGPVTNCLLQMQGAWVQSQSIFSWGHPWKPRFKSGFHNSFWDLGVPCRISWMTLEIYKWNLGTSFS